MDEMEKDIVRKFLTSIIHVQNNLLREGRLPTQLIDVNYNNQDIVRLSLRMQNLISEFSTSSVNESYQQVKETLEEIGEDTVTFNKLVIELGYPPHGDIPADLISSVV